MGVQTTRYDDSDVKSIVEYAKKLVNSTLRKETDAKSSESNKVRVKGKFGQYLEKYYFGINNNSKSRPDFEKVNLELKSTPMKRLKHGGYSIKERLVLNMIDYNSIVDETWEHSHFLSKNELILLVIYLFEQEKDFLDFLIKYVHLLKIEGTDREIIRQDWNAIVNKIREGKAHELSEGDTFYLGACRKGWKEAPVKYTHGGDIPAKKRAFSFKQNYMNSLLKQLKDSESLVKDVSELKKKGIQDIVDDRLAPFKGLEVSAVEKRLEIRLNNKAKNYYEMLARRMMGVSAKKIDEFEKADITMKIIRLKSSGMPKESMSFKAFDFKEVAEQSWDESEFSDQIENKFFFVVFQINKDESVTFEKSFFWTMPLSDRKEAEKVWKKTQKIIREGVKITRKDGKNFNNLPGSKESPVAHVRPHGQDSRDVLKLPDGRKMTKQCFWFNQGYIKEVVANHKD
ncbi:DNA mismatch repair protein [Candidatus Woesearchaeota archaeon CG10_big_fil_rev_8_21_14_0_10_32_9]|nr:MAG: DNA mismatch repair protein [Candidatus Woesearchaeota archaeon CG10_big_fil_rev_8_21_14_0_10_32_9]